MHGRRWLVAAVVLVLAGAVAWVALARPAARLTGTVTVVGSTTVTPVSELLAHRFMELNPGVRVTVQAGGSTPGIRAAQEGAADIGQSSRNLRPAEQALHQVIIARDGMPIIVHPTNPVSNLTLAQVRDIFAGRITNWKEVGGQDRPIIPVVRESGSGAFGAFLDKVMGDVPLTDRAITQNGQGAIVAAISTTPDAIGYVSIPALIPAVKAISIDGVMPTAANVLAGTYPISRPFIYVTRQEPAGVTKSFIDFVMGTEGQAIVRMVGLVSPVTPR